MTVPTNVWVFLQAEQQFPGGVFSSRGLAEAWIEKHRLTGVLTAYPLDKGVFDWAVERGFFKPTKPEHTSSRFVGGFTCARMDHAHFEDGRSIG